MVESEQAQKSEYQDNYELGRQQKQHYLIDHVANPGYDTRAFAAFMEA